MENLTCHSALSGQCSVCNCKLQHHLQNAKIRWMHEKKQNYLGAIDTQRDSPGDSSRCNVSHPADKPWLLPL